MSFLPVIGCRSVADPLAGIDEVGVGDAVGLSHGLPVAGEHAAEAVAGVDDIDTVTRIAGGDGSAIDDGLCLHVGSRAVGCVHPGLALGQVAEVASDDAPGHHVQIDAAGRVPATIAGEDPVDTGLHLVEAAAKQDTALGQVVIFSPDDRPRQGFDVADWRVGVGGASGRGDGVGGAGSARVLCPGDGVAVEPVDVDAVADAGHVAGAGVLPCGDERPGAHAVRWCPRVAQPVGGVSA